MNSAESLVERQKKAMRELAHLVENCNNRLRLQDLDVAKRYVEGRLEICVKLRSRYTGEEVHLFVRRRLIRTSEFNTVDAVNLIHDRCFGPIGLEVKQFVSPFRLQVQLG